MASLTKEQVLGEIRRVGAILGRTPGRGEIFKYAGIRESDWLGKHWARWKDAVSEAGFQPNQLKSAIPTEVLFDHLIALTRQLGKLPTAPEMKLAHRNNPAFPSVKTFERLGSRTDLVEALRTYCSARDGFDDIVSACQMVEAREPFSSAGREASEEIAGFVYLLKSGRFYKVGKTNALGRREREIAMQLPERASTVHAISTDDPSGIESYWHRRFADRRRNGEWFELTPADVSAFRRRKFM